MIDPDNIADNLPDQPLQPEQINSILQDLGWDAAPVVRETEGGTEFVRTVYCYDDQSQRAMAIRIDDGKWTGTIEAEGVDRSTWLQVTQTAADCAGLESGISQMEFDDGTVRSFE